MKILLYLLFTLTFMTAHSQEMTQQPRIGVAVSATGASLCLLGATMKSQVMLQYTPLHGYSYVNVPSPSRNRTQMTTLICGATFTIVGIIIQNIKRKRNGK